MDPNFLLNLTTKFENLVYKQKGDMSVVQKFTEQKSGSSDMQEL